MLPIHFAPLQGYTEAPYRLIHHEVCGGIDSYYTPFIRLEHGQIRKKDLREALPGNNVGIQTVPQVIASSAEEFRTLCLKLTEAGHRRIDINMGCPFPLQTRLGRGSGIWLYPERVEEILMAAKELTASAQLEFSLKMRLGQEDPSESLALLGLINDTPLMHVTLHPRVGRQQYKGELLMDVFERFYAESAHPLILNGDITTLSQMQELEAHYPKLGGLMLGRGLLARPTLAAEYEAGKALTDDEVKQRVLTMHRQLLAHYQERIEGGDAQLLQKMHSFWDYMEPLFGHKPVKKVLKSGSMRNYLEAVANVR